MKRRMDTSSLAHLLALRYRLLWAQARMGNGKLLWLLVGWQLGMLVMAFIALGGFGAAQAAIEMGQADRVARTALGWVFPSAIFTSAVLGTGVDPAFSDASLRRYPLSPSQRFVARHATALLGPVWLLVLALYLGLAAGLSLSDTGRPWLALPAALVLVVANYLSSRVLLEWIRRILQTRIGQVALFALSVPLALVTPMLLMSSASGMSEASAALTQVLHLTPPGVAAAAMVDHQVASSLTSFAGLLAWSLGLGVALVQWERRPPYLPSMAGTAARWDDLYDRASSLFGPQLGPLVGKNLRYYVRSAHLRWNYPLTIPILTVMVWQATRNRADEPMALFLAVLGAFSRPAWCRWYRGSH